MSRTFLNSRALLSCLDLQKYLINLVTIRISLADYFFWLFPPLLYLTHKAFVFKSLPVPRTCRAIYTHSILDLHCYKWFYQLSAMSYKMSKTRRMTDMRFLIRSSLDQQLKSYFSLFPQARYSFLMLESSYAWPVHFFALSTSRSNWRLNCWWSA